MRLTDSLITAAALVLTLTPLAKADSIQLSVSSSFRTNIESGENFWGSYSTDYPFTAFPTSGNEPKGAYFSSISLLVPSGNVVTSAIIRIPDPVGVFLGTAADFIERRTAPPRSGPSVAPTFSGNGITKARAQFDDYLTPRFLPIINGNEVSTGNLYLIFDVGGSMQDFPVNPGINWTGLIGGTGSVEIPYTVQLDVTYSPVPEPSSIALLGTGLLGLAGVARRKFLA